MALKQIMFIFGLESAIILAATISPESSNIPSPCNPNKYVGCSYTECKEICGCDRTYIYNEEKAECILNIEYLQALTVPKNYASSENDMVLEDGIATKIRESVDRVFRGIIASAIFFIICCSVCVISVLIFCCHSRRSDRKLKNEVDALAKKMKINIRKKDSSRLSNKPHGQIDESCNVLVQDANVMCV